MKLELTFEGMTCQACAASVEKALGAVPGVDTAHVSYATKRGVVTAAETVSTAHLLEVVESTGYRAQVVGGDARVGTGTAGDQRASTAHGQAQREQDSGGWDYDLLIVGTGGAGTAAAIRGSELGARIAIVEGADLIGGTCVNVGCIPSKNLIEAAAHYHMARTGFPGIVPCDPQLAWQEVLCQKRAIVEELRQEKYLDVLASHEGVTLLHGRAKLLGAGRVQVGDAEVAAGKIVLATGTSPVMPSIPGLEEAGALDSTTAMDLERLPESLVVIGAGSIGLELGQTFSRFGVKVVILDVARRILPTEDPDISEALSEALKAEGIEIHTDVRVTHVSRDAHGYTIAVEDGSLKGEFRAEQLLAATGRSANTAGLGLEAAGVETDARGFIPVDAFMRTSNPNVFAAGDVTGGPGYVYVAALGGGIASQTALSDVSREEPIPIDLAATPRVTFTDPQVASVGMTDEDARAAGLQPQTTTLPIRYLPRAIVSHRTAGVVKLISEVGTDRLLGAHIVSPNAGDVIAEAVLAFRFGLTSRDIVSTLHPYLTWAEGLKLAAQTFTKDVAKLSCCA